MKGYFARIAKQSGLRFSGQKASPRLFSVGKPAAENLSPLEREETIMVPPFIPDKRSMETPALIEREETIMVPPSIPDKRSMETPALIEREETIMVPPSIPDKRSMETPALIGESSDKEPVLKELRIVTDPADNAEYPSPSKTENVLLGEKPSGELSVIERTVFAEELKDAKDAKAPPAPETEKKDYFLKTAEIIEKGEAGTAEIHEILFQEIQEWVAGSPLAAKIPDPGTEEVIETVVTKEVVRPQSRQLETIREKVEAENIERADLSEQTFELSIGTISVVIEESEKPRQPEPSPRTANNQNSGTETKREFSRLSRNYL